MRELVHVINFSPPSEREAPSCSSAAIVVLLLRLLKVPDESVPVWLLNTGRG